jgi:hypothetical protein
MDGLQPEVQREMRGLKDGSDPHGEGLLAGVALAKAWTGGFPRETPYMFLSGTAEWAGRPLWPKPSFDVSERRFFILEMGFGKNGLGHDEISYGQNTIDRG